jgi:glucan endo-1,3-alpha-glucosidase
LAFNPTTDVGLMSTYMQRYSNLPAQFKVDDGAFVSSFIGDGFPFRDVENQSGVKLFACPNWQPGSLSNNAK